jgi:hypothetical protein
MAARRLRENRIVENVKAMVRYERHLTSVWAVRGVW